MIDFKVKAAEGGAFVVTVIRPDGEATYVCTTHAQLVKLFKTTFPKDKNEA